MNKVNTRIKHLTKKYKDLVKAINDDTNSNIAGPIFVNSILISTLGLVFILMIKFWYITLGLGFFLHSAVEKNEKQRIFQANMHQQRLEFIAKRIWREFASQLIIKDNHKLGILSSSLDSFIVSDENLINIPILDYYFTMKDSSKVFEDSELRDIYFGMVKQLEKLIKVFSEEHPNIPVEYKGVPIVSLVGISQNGGEIRLRILYCENDFSLGIYNRTFNRVNNEGIRMFNEEFDKFDEVF